MTRARQVHQRKSPGEIGRREATEDIAKASKLRRWNRETEEQQNRMMEEYRAQVGLEQKAQATKIAKEVLQEILNKDIP